MAEVDLGSVNNNATNRARGFVGSRGDDLDTFSFRTVPFGNGDNSNINISLTGMTDNLNVRLYRDFNNNGIVDRGDRLLASSFRSGRNDESINLSALRSGVDAGSYVIEVDPVGSAESRYDLKVSASAFPDPSLLLPTEREVGTLRGRRTFNDSVSSSDTVDTYHFNVTSRRRYNFSTTASGLAGVNIRLIDDRNNNLEVNFGEEIARSENFGGSESISRVLDRGDYYLQVYNVNGSSNYTLNMS